MSTLPNPEDRGVLAALMLAAPYLILLLVTVVGLALVLREYLTVQDAVRVVSDHSGKIVISFALAAAFAIAQLGSE